MQHKWAYDARFWAAGVFSFPKTVHLMALLYTVAINELLCLKIRAPRYQCFSHQMNNRHPWQLKKSWALFWSYQLTALPIQPIWLIFAVNRLNWQCCLAGSSKMAPRILIFSIAVGADYSFELISVVHWVPQFIGHNKTFLGSVDNSPRDLCVMTLNII